MESDEFARRILKRAARENAREPMLEIAGKRFTVPQLEAVQAAGHLGQWGPHSQHFIEQFIRCVREHHTSMILLNWPGAEVEIEEFWPAGSEAAFINLKRIPGRLIIDGVMADEDSDKLSELNWINKNHDLLN